MARRLALALALAAVLVPAAARRLAPTGSPLPVCAPAGRGSPPRGWIGCATDPGGTRGFTDEERLVLRLPLDPNRASARALAFLPGLGPALGRAIAAEREAHGPFADLDDLRRVRGIGPKRLEQARSTLAVAPGAVAPRADAR
ncbi:MAG TPA: helix-hairpin-helix domain-containing protein [Anaeromyxobacteraceae bacterium]|nr:helix-hairpin-helix domain-containing protein [Anaeromyxobacteraceae bacterium]